LAAITARSGVPATAATSSVKHGKAVTAAGPATGWSPAALHTADGLARRIAASLIGCTDYATWSYDELASDMKNHGLPVPAAVSHCQSAAQEDLTFDVFASESSKRAFVAAKLAVLCKAATKAKLPFTFTYVDDPRWIVEPDEKETALTLAAVLGASVRHDPCS
jgi:hypothetical protein